MLEKIKRFILESNLICFNGLIFVPDFEKLHLEVLEYVHDSLSAGHFGQHRTFELLTRNYWWPGCRSFVKDYVKTYHICTRAKPSREKPYSLLEPLQIPTRP